MALYMGRGINSREIPVITETDPVPEGICVQ